MGNDIVVPYSGYIPGGIRVGTDVVINGRVNPNATRLSVNLCVGPTYEQDCAFHLNPRFDEGHVVRNHMQGGSWGVEERAGGNPFRRAMGFEMHMKVTQHGYKVTVNGRHLCDFHHRLPKESVQYIYIEGDVHIYSIKFQGGSVPTAHHQHHQHHAPTYPTGPAFPATPAYPPTQAYPPTPAFQPTPAYPPTPAFPPTPQYPPASVPTPGCPAGGVAGPVYNPVVPFTTPIPGGIYPGKIVYISGIPRNGERFTVNLLCGPSDAYDIALHFDVRFNYGGDSNVVVRTHKQGGNYGGEERQIAYFPFMQNVNFEMMILAENTGFKVAVNNQHFIEFLHRIQPLQRCTHLNVQGDVQLTQVRFQ